MIIILDSSREYTREEMKATVKEQLFDSYWAENETQLRSLMFAERMVRFVGDPPPDASKCYIPTINEIVDRMIAKRPK